MVRCEDEKCNWAINGDKEAAGDHAMWGRAHMTWVAGVDGCRAGWVVVVAHAVKSGATPRLLVCRRFMEVLRATPQPTVIAIDIPIGLLDRPQRGGRVCDQEARRLLGRRASSVFSPPSRQALKARHYSEVRRQGLSRQAFGILPKIREVDRLMTSQLQGRVYEAHPELAFRALAEHPMRYNKKTTQGRRERLSVLQHSWPKLAGILRKAFKELPGAQASPDDLLDAAALALAARRLAQKRAVRIPPRPPKDRKGLRMEMWY